MKMPDFSKSLGSALHRKLPAAPRLPALRAADTRQAAAAAGTLNTAGALNNETGAAPNAVGSPVWRALSRPFRIINWRILAAALFGIGIVHIIATLAAPSLTLSAAYHRLEGVLPTNRPVILPPVSPQNQPLPFMTPALRYAMCRYDTANGPVDVSVELGATGSSLTIYTVDGEAVYTAAQSEVPLHMVRITPADGRFLGLTPEARGHRSSQVPSATLHADRGVVVYATPDLGVSYQSATQHHLAAASCNPSRAN